MSKVHDNIIISYQVDFENETFIIKTQYDDDKICENTDVSFTGYLTHIFHHEMKNSIIFDIEEYPLNSFLESERELIEEGKNYCWPIIHETTSELVKYLELNDYKTFSLSSSLGLYGWVLAKSMKFICKNGK